VETGNFKNLSYLKTFKKKDDKGWTVKAVVPGFKKEDLKIEIKKKHIIVEGIKTDNPESYSFKEVVYFAEELNEKESNAKLENGILTIDAVKKNSELEKKTYLEIE